MPDLQDNRGWRVGGIRQRGVRSAMAFQEHLSVQESSWPEVLRIRYRIGLNLGDVVVQGDDVLEDAVNLASRLEGLADPGGISISSAVYDRIIGNLGNEFEDAEDAKTARQCLRRSLSLNTHSDFVNVIQSSYNIWVAGDIPAALRDVERALEINPHFGTGQAMLGLITILNGGYREGIEGISRVTASLMQNPIYHLVMSSEALGLFALGEDKEYLTCAHKSLQQQPTFVPSMLHVIAVAQRMGEVTEVKRMKAELLSDCSDFSLSQMRTTPFRAATMWAEYHICLVAADLPA